MEPSIFTKIINGDIPCHKVYEDDMTFAFMDINPILPGHVLVVPKQQIDHFDDLPDEVSQAVTNTVKKISKVIRNLFDVSRSTVHIMGYDVPHAHAHVLPCDDSLTLHKAFCKLVNTNQKLEVNHEELEKIAEEIRSNL